VHFGLTVALCEASELDAALRHGYRGLELARQAAGENDQADFLRLLWRSTWVRSGTVRNESNCARPSSLPRRPAFRLALSTTLTLADSSALLADAATIWAANAACLCVDALIDVPHDARRR
jgi:hypothetical protein